MHLFQSSILQNIADLFIDFLSLIQKYKDIKILRKLKKSLNNITADVLYVTEGQNWVIEMEGTNIAKVLNKKKDFKIQVISKRPRYLKNKIIHWGSINTLMTEKYFAYLDKTNRNILVWYHVIEGDPRTKYLPVLNKRLDIIQSSSFITKEKLIENGIEEDKFIFIPLGIDLSVFVPYSKEKKEPLKKKFDLPPDKLIIGSFQKDGEGWEEGLVPKMVKGPDVLVNVLEKINKKKSIHVFLTGPARGYVKQELRKRNIPFTHVYLKDFNEMVQCYNVIDLYIVPSREEGGPKAILESMATGVPIVSTNVGIAPHIIKNGINGFITEIEDIDDLTNKSLEILNNRALYNKLIREGYKIIKEYSWIQIANKYYLPLYKKLAKR